MSPVHLPGAGELEAVWELLEDHVRQAEARPDAPQRGKLTGVGVGPGDPELLTLKALKRIQACDLLICRTPTGATAWLCGVSEKAWPGGDGRKANPCLCPCTT
ncbi:MAG: SAM-dependent methyltransferase [Oscillospiraceae bacterium]